MRKEERYKGVLNWFNEHVPVVEIGHQHLRHAD